MAKKECIVIDSKNSNSGRTKTFWRVVHTDETGDFVHHGGSKAYLYPLKTGESRSVDYWLNSDCQKKPTMDEASKIEEAMKPWTAAYNQAALKEGWCLSVNSGNTLSIQVQRIDDPESASEETGIAVPELDSDDVAMQIVLNGKLTHHNLARDILKNHSQAEWDLVQNSGVASAAA